MFWDPLNRYYSLLVKYKYTILCFSILCLRCKLCPDSGHIIEIQKLLFILELFWSNFIERISILHSMPQQRVNPSQLNIILCYKNIILVIFFNYRSHELIFWKSKWHKCILPQNETFSSPIDFENIHKDSYKHSHS